MNDADRVRGFRGLSRRGFCAASLLTFSPLRAAFASTPSAGRISFDVLAWERKRILAAAPALAKAAPTTVTASRSPRSSGGKHDYFSEADYWWPDPKNADGPYIQRDGQTNPENFDEHRKAMRRLSVVMPSLTAAYLVTRKRSYAKQAAAHLDAWFVNPDTAMAPHLKFSQAIRNKVTGRSIGVIDTIHLVEVVRAATVLAEAGVLDRKIDDGTRTWFRAYLTWLTEHEYGTTERDAKNNHGTCWVLQAAEFARYTGNAAVTSDCIKRYKTILLPQQMGADGSFPLELARTKPYGYSLFNLDIMAGVCQILTTPEDNLWTFELPDGRGMKKALAFIYPYILDKKTWPKKPDVMYWDQWPLRHPALLFGGLAFNDSRYVDLWKTLNGDPTVDEAIRNFPIRQPALWLTKTNARKA
ncbi:MAG TPA: alginate lyase family protein [Polyangia bacterium]